MSNTFGKHFRITTCGESHGPAIAVIIDGCPSGLSITVSEIQQELNRRKPGQSEFTSPRRESDRVEILSGVFQDTTTGAPILLLIKNHDAKSEDYEALKNLYRPSHADFTYQKKYGVRDYRGSGRASARETVARVAAGAIAKKYLHHYFGITVLSYVEQVGDIKTNIDFNFVSENDIESNAVRCPDNETAKKMMDKILEIKKQGDSIGGVIRGVIRHAPIGLGDPVFDKLSANLAHAMMSIPAAKGFDIGAGFDCVHFLGSAHNDLMQTENDRVVFQSNHAGGVLGGITTGEPIYFRVAFKPVATISKKQMTTTVDQQNVVFEAAGRHDPCVLPRAVPVVDAMAALVIMDALLSSKIADTISLCKQE